MVRGMWGNTVGKECVGQYSWYALCDAIQLVRGVWGNTVGRGVWGNTVGDGCVEGNTVGKGCVGSVVTVPTSLYALAAIAIYGALPPVTHALPATAVCDR